MDRIHYAGDSLLTGTEIARAVLDYAQALAETDTSATVDIPVVGPDGGLTRAELLIGPASQLVTTQVDGEDPEVIDDILSASLRRKAHNLRNQGATDAGADAHGGHSAEDWPEFDGM